MPNTALMLSSQPQHSQPQHSQPQQTLENSRVATHFLICINKRAADSPLPCCGCGGEAVFAAFTREIARRGYPPGVKVTPTGCLTPCQQGPNVIVYPQGLWYAGVTPEDAAALVAAHLDNGPPQTHLLLPPEVQVT